MLLVIGYGNTLNSDDGFGIAVGEALLARNLDAKVKVIIGHQLKPEFMEDISQAGAVIFVDASKNLQPGQFEKIELFALKTLQNVSSERSNHGTIVAGTLLTHHYTPEQLMQGACLLYGKTPLAWLYSVGGENFTHGEKISSCMLAAIPNVVAAILSATLIHLEVAVAPILDSNLQ